MPEGPEVHLAAHFVNQMAKKYSFSGRVEKSVVSTKNPDIPWDCPKYSIDATARGKEMRITLTEKAENSRRKSEARRLPILFHFGMSGKFEMTQRGKSHKHSHLKFFTSDGKFTLSFVDMRRFGRWSVTDDWSEDRGPCVLTESNLLPDHLSSLLDSSRLKNRPICEALLDQRLFNGVGNYLRAEILHRAGTPPFTAADQVLHHLREGRTPRVLELVWTVPQEVLAMNLKLGAGRPTYMHDADQTSGPEMDAFYAWLRCYGRDGMKTVKDAHGRTVWFAGAPGPLLPKSQNSQSKRKVVARKRKANATGDSEANGKASAVKKKVKEEVEDETKVEVKHEIKKEVDEEIEQKALKVKEEKNVVSDSTSVGQTAASKRSTARRNSRGSQSKLTSVAQNGTSAKVKAEIVDPTADQQAAGPRRTSRRR